MSSSNMQLAQDVKMFLWATYDPDDSLTYPTINNWGDLLAEMIEDNSYDTLTKDEVLSILFGLLHRNRIVEGLWWSMFERGVTQKLLERLLVLDTDNVQIYE
jgi:histone acetyltransferase (RNA polymerase elongator complex component)